MYIRSDVHVYIFIFRDIEVCEPKDCARKVRNIDDGRTSSIISSQPLHFPIDNTYSNKAYENQNTTDDTVIIQMIYCCCVVKKIMEN